MKVVLDYRINGCKLKYYKNGVEHTITDKNEIRKFVSDFRDVIQVIYNNSRIQFIYSNGNELIITGDVNKFDKTDIFNSVRELVNRRLLINSVNIKRLAALAGTTIVLSSFISKKINNPENNPEKINVPATISNPHIDNEAVIEKPQQRFAETYDFNERLAQTLEFQSMGLNENLEIPISTEIRKYSINKLNTFLSSEDGKKLYQYCEEYGVDPYVMVGLFMAESSLRHNDTIPGGSCYNGSAYGYGQLEKPDGRKVQAFNYKTNQIDEISISKENAINASSNIKISVMIFQNVFNKYKGNINLALQSYNYGNGMIDFILTLYSDETGKTKEEIIEDKTDIGWLKYVYAVHDNPHAVAQKYSNYKDRYPNILSKLANAYHNSYGNGHYISHVLSYYIGVFSKNNCGNKEFIYNLVEGTLLENPIKEKSLIN